MVAEKNSLRGYIHVLIACAILCIVMGAIFGNRMKNERPDSSVVSLDTEPELIDGEFYFTFPIPDEDIEGKCIAFPTRHFETKVLIDDEVVYSLVATNPRLNHSTGYHWNFIPLKNSDHGKNIQIVFTPTYKNIYPDREFFFGSRLDIMNSIIQENGIRFLMAIMIFIVGIVLLVYAVFIVEKDQRDDTLIHFSVFSLMLAIWSMMESPICELIPVSSVYNLVIDHYALMVMPAAFMMFMRHTFNIKSNKIWIGYARFNILVVVVRTILQMTTIKDLKETLWMTQLSIMIFVVLSAGWAIKAIQRGHLTKAMKTNLFWIAMLLAATVVEMFLFVVLHKSNLIGMIGFVCYIVVMAMEMVRKSRKQMKHAQEAELYRKLAFTDELTGAYNRTAFGRDMENCLTVNEKTGKQMIRPTTLFMFDLNDLKKCNDNYGHEYGDQYIKMISEVILRVIGVDGKCYRIGGDEFCAIMNTNVQSEIDSKLIAIIQEVEMLDRKGFVVPVSVALGYATYNPEYDENLDDTMKRADTLMYQNKQLIKKNRMKKTEEA